LEKKISEKIVLGLKLNGERERGSPTLHEPSVFTMLPEDYSL